MRSQSRVAVGLGVAVLFCLLGEPGWAQPTPGPGCMPDPGSGRLWIRRVVRDKNEIVLFGKGFDKQNGRVLIDDDFVVNTSSVAPDEIRFPVGAYRGKKVLPAHVKVTVETLDGSQSSSCEFDYPGDFPFFIGASGGLSTRHGSPAALAVGFVGLWGSAQEEIPTLHSDGTQMSIGGHIARRLYLVGGIAKVADTEGFPLALGVGFRLSGDVRLMYVCRFNKDDYPHHIFAIGGTLNVEKALRGIK